VTTARVRDPARKERILSAAADLVARRGFTAVSMEDIGEAVGITASAIYRHYDSKNAVLVAMFDRVVDKLLSEGQAIAAAGIAPQEALARLVDGQIEFVLTDREVAQVYFREIAQVPEADRRRLRRNQRLYVEEWVLLLTELRPGLDDAGARALVHAAIGVNYVVSGALIGATYLLAWKILGMFIVEPTTLAIAHGLLMITLWSYAIFGNSAVLSGTMRASGAVAWPTAINIASIWAVEVPVAFILMQHLGLSGIWIGYPAAFCAGLAAQTIYYKAAWKGRRFERLV